MRIHCALPSLDLSLISQLAWRRARMDSRRPNLRKIPSDGTIILPYGQDFTFSKDCQGDCRAVHGGIRPRTSNMSSPRSVVTDGVSRVVADAPRREAR